MGKKKKNNLELEHRGGSTKVMTLKYLSTDESNYEIESDNEECQQS